MIVIKRDGREVEYDKSKIINAINKANAEVVLKDKVSLEQIDEIITSLAVSYTHLTLPTTERV